MELSYWYYYIVDVTTYALSSVICKTAEMTGNYFFSMGVSNTILRISTFTAYLLLGVAVVGALSEIKRNPHIVFLVIVSFVGTSIVNLGQGLRYLYVILPFTLSFSFVGLKAVFGCAMRILKYIFGGFAGKRNRDVGRIHLKPATFKLMRPQPHRLNEIKPKGFLCEQAKRKQTLFRVCFLCRLLLTLYTNFSINL